MTENLAKSIDSIADTFATEICDAILAQPAKYDAHLKELEDLKLSIVREAKGLLQPIKIEDSEFLWNLAAKLPDFNTDALYQKRTTVISLAAAVICGWLLGGLLSGLLNLFALGGDILRAFAIFCMVWLSEYLGANPKSRKIFLTVLGLGGLARFGTMLAAGMVRFTGFSSLRQMIFGAARPNIFKGTWLLIGAFFMFIFFSKKISSLDITAFKESLKQQIKQDLELVVLVLKQVAAFNKKLAECRQAETSNSIAKDEELVQSLLGIMDSLDDERRAFLLAKLNAAGFETHAEDDDILIWNEKIHSPLYDTIGLVQDGDKCRILRRAVTSRGKIIKGHVQKL